MAQKKGCSYVNKSRERHKLVGRAEGDVVNGSLDE